MATEVLLKYKYRMLKPRGRYHSGYGGNNNKAKQHRQLSAAELERHAQQPAMVRVLLPSGKTRVMRLNDWLARQASG